jgi:predicted nucleic acid-binding protein
MAQTWLILVLTPFLFFGSLIYLIPVNDVWIAAHALETGSILLTSDDHFTVIHGLRLWDELGH